MTIKNLWMQHFRSYTHTFLSFSPLTVVVGPNAAGKTNLLEAIYFLSLGKSFRAQHDKEAISFSSDIARIKSHVCRGEEIEELEIVLTHGSIQGTKTPTKKYVVNGVNRRAIDLIGTCLCVLFWPQDLDLITHTPSYRRKFLDHALMMVDRSYRRALTTYEQALRRRNSLLHAIREGHARRAELSYWDDLVIEHGQYISKKRSWYVSHINQTHSPTAELSYTLVYDHSEISVSRLAQYADAEIASATTLVGPQRDDIMWMAKKGATSRNLGAYGSRGEQRLGVLWAKMGEAQVIFSVTGERPVILLDDVFSELDTLHREAVSRLVYSHQTIMTTTDLSFLDADLSSRATILSAPIT